MSKSITIKFDFPSTRNNGVEVTHNDVVEIINGCIYDMDSDFSNEVTYTVIEKK